MGATVALLEAGLICLVCSNTRRRRRTATPRPHNRQVLPGSFYPPLFSGEKVNWTEYHVFSLEWDKCELRFFVDDVNYHNKTCAEVRTARLTPPTDARRQALTIDPCPTFHPRPTYPQTRCT